MRSCFGKRNSTRGELYAIKHYGQQSIKSLIPRAIREMNTELGSNSSKSRTRTLKEKIGEALKDANVR